MFYTLSVLLRRGSNFILNIMIARVLTVQEFGEFSQLTIIAIYLLLVTEFGYNEYILVKAKKNNNLKFLLSNFFIISIITFIILSLILGIFHQSEFIYLILLKVYLDSYLNKLILTYYQYENKFNIYSKLTIFYSLSLLSLSYYLYLNHLSLYCTLIIINILLLLMTIALVKKSNIEFRMINLGKIKEYINKEFTYFALSSITIPIYMQMPLFIMIFFVSKENIAVFYLAYVISSVMLLLSVSVNQQFLPKFIHNKKVDFFIQIKIPILLLVGLNFFIFLIFLFFGEFIIINILNKSEYMNANQYILLLMLSNLFQSVSGIIALYLVVNNLMKKKLNIHIELIFISLVLSIILIYIYGILGVALSYIILYIYTFIRYTSIVVKIKNLEKLNYGK